MVITGSGAFATPQTPLSSVPRVGYIWSRSTLSPNLISSPDKLAEESPVLNLRGGACTLHMTCSIWGRSGYCHASVRIAGRPGQALTVACPKVFKKQHAVSELLPIRSKSDGSIRAHFFGSKAGCSICESTGELNTLEKASSSYQEDPTLKGGKGKARSKGGRKGKPQPPSTLRQDEELETAYRRISRQRGLPHYSPPQQAKTKQMGESNPSRRKSKVPTPSHSSSLEAKKALFGKKGGGQ